MSLLKVNRVSFLKKKKNIPLFPLVQSDRKKAQNAMEAAWKAMEKKEKIPWIKKAAEDQKRYEVQYRTVVSDQTF